MKQGSQTVRVGTRSEPPDAPEPDEDALWSSERERLESIIRDNDLRFGLLFNNHPQPMWIYALDTLQFVAVNDAALTLYGYTRGEFLGMTLPELHPAEDVVALLDQIPDHRIGFAASHPSRHRRKGGAVIDVDVAGHDMTYQGSDARLIVAMEVTQRKRAELALRESERRFREMLESMQLLAVTLDGAGAVTFCNDFLLSITGYSREEIYGKCWFDLFCDAAVREETRQAFLGKIESGLAVPHDETEIVTRKGDRRLISFSNTVLRDFDGRVIGTASIGSDVTEQRSAEKKLAHDALHDALTGLPNRALFLERLEGAMGRARRREDYAYAVLFVDLDRFKVINESLGHTIGDRLLIEAGRVLKECVRPEDTVARLGGDEFTILVDDTREELYATRIANKIHDALSTPFNLDGNEIFTTASIGVALSTATYERPEDVLRDADTAMYRAKARGKSRHEIFDTSMHKRAVALLALETDLRRAIERKELRLVFQPIVSLKTGVVAGFEALARWKHPRRGEVSPMEFIPVAEETGLITPIGRWVVREACAEMRRWLDSHPNAAPALSMSVNLSTKQLQPGLIDEVDRALADAELEPTRLKLEITESVLMDNAESALALLRALRARGVSLSIDDFGTGYSSLSYLLRFPIDTLKIDRAFVKGMGDGDEGGEHLELVRTIVTLARNLGLDVVAEGVETTAQRIRLEALGCQHAQGFLFSPPVDGDAAARLIGGAALGPKKRASEAPRL